MRMGNSLRGMWFRATAQKGQKSSSLILSVLVGLSMAYLLVHTFNAALRPQLLAFAEAQIQNHLNLISAQVVNQVMLDQNLDYSSLVVLQTGQGGDVTTMSVNAPKLNLLRTQVMECITEQILAWDTTDIGIPFGLLTGVDILSATGPKLPVRITSVASATGIYRNEFTDAGINQTLHRIVLDVTITARLLLPVGSTETTVTIPVYITEAIIIGQVPQTYLNWMQ